MLKLQLKALSTQLISPTEFNLEAGECISIRGNSGSGKTQLLRAIADLDEHQGTVLLDDIPCEQIAAPLWRHRVALLPANPLWWHDTVGEHFAAVDDEQLKALGFEHEVLHWPVDRLSSGEQQRLALARLLSRSPEVLLLDEATANLDNANARKVELLIQSYRQNKPAAVIWVSHDSQQQQRVASRHYSIAQGNLIELIRT